MEKVSENIKAAPEETPGFFKYVFNFDDDNKGDILNMFQYTLLGIIPVILTLKAVKHIFPEEDESKGSLEIFAESVGQILFIVALIWFIDRIIRYVPTYSGNPYNKFMPTNFMLPFLLILATMQTKFAAKINILVERVGDIYYGTSNDNKNSNNQGQVKVSQPISQHQPSQADYLDTNQLLPNNRQLTSMPQSMPPPTAIAPQNSPDFNQMYQNTVTPMPGAAVPDMQEPMAANEAFGGMFGGTAW